MRPAPAAALRALAEAEPRPFWLDGPAPPARPQLVGEAEADLLVVGGGLTGLWAALQAVEEAPGRSVLVLEGETIAFGASGRNGGFLESSLTHGLANGLARWPEEMETVERLGRESYAAILATLERHGIDCGLEETGVLYVATEPHHREWLDEEAEIERRFGSQADVLDRDGVRAELDSPTYLGGVWLRGGRCLVDPVRLARGLARAAEAGGAAIHERTKVNGLRAEGSGLVATTPHGRVRARRAILATSAFPPLARAIRRYVVPVYDYVLVTEPLDEARRAGIGWRHRQGVADVTNQFHYYRLTPDDRILWGGYEAIYHFGNGIGGHLDQRPQTHALLAEQFFHTFPALEGLCFSHRWGGAIDTCSRFCATFGRAVEGRAAYAVGFTGLGVGASRFGARVALDLVDGRETERTQLRMVREKPWPFPPEPLRYAGIQLTRRALARADERQGRRGPWLRVLDRLGMGFDS
jgi:glycine/D-amino acid oxidase-like deaminating enzyme